ncbi:hypothetical protein [Streptomyces sp. ISL-94]|uniref:hypothetical protein n=1 Tax=Streptomyces sp. ISL-94 TaxID=2819190 RepID=UPI001BEC0D33|nr:hypothetical protein [Streptomyces sp. ISL-94]MBT2480799.1 hypothetical protein [Streptomyces sp. ISL-94]
MARISEETKQHHEQAIQAAMDRLLRGELPPGGRCDLKTLAAEAGVSRTGFYPKKDRAGNERPGPYQHLAEEFERRVRAKQEAGEITDPRDAQITRLKGEVEQLRTRVAQRNDTITELTEFRTRAVSRLAAQHEEIQRLRKALDGAGNVRTLPVGGRPGPA